MFNDDISAAIQIWQEQNHINMLIKIWESEMVPLAYRPQVAQAVEAAVLNYLQTYASEDI
jgi:malic enzyme